MLDLRKSDKSTGRNAEEDPKDKILVYDYR